MVLNTETKQQLENLLAKPGSATQSDIPLLQQLIKTFPYYQPLHLLLAKASTQSENQHSAYTKAALYANGGILHRVIHEPQKLEPLEELNVIAYQAWTNVPFEIASEQMIEVEATTPPQVVTQAPEIENLEPLGNEVIAAETTEIPKVEEVEETPLVTPEADFIVPEIENLEPLANEVIAVETAEETEIPKEEDVEEIPTVTPETKIDFVVPEIENLAPLENEIIRVCEADAVAEEPERIKETVETDEQETFEEITEFVAPAEEVLVKDAEPEEAIAQSEDTTEVETVEDEIEITEETAQQEEAPEIETVEIADETEELAAAVEDKTEAVAEEEELEIETFAATDFFAFDRNFSAEKVTEEEETETETVTSEVIEEPIFSPHVAEENIVSKYDDDKLPFTFLWWLAKTRKDHEQIFRPFASPVKANAQPLQQQYVEHIFHIQAPLELGEEEQTLAVAQQTKGNEIIDNFIKNDPQIKALKPDQINNENKAKRSAEDSNDLVSETLAQIYIEQMLYHKAIDTYQKLSLKFPEKSGYFADLIQSLEKKI